MTTDLVSRIQFAFTVSFHILFPAMSIGLVTFLTIMEAVWLKTKDPKYKQICRFWTKVFALTFGMGIVSGIVMEFQFGANWAGFTNVVGPALGALFTYEVLTAFFIEAGFLGVMLFGWDRVGEKLHFFSTLLVWIGTTLSAFWILSANSWMQTPDGFMRQAGKLVVTSWYHLILNPSVLPRFTHMLLSAYITAAFVIAGVSAHYLLKKKHEVFAKTCFSFSTLSLLVLIVLQIFMGDRVGLEVHKNQPIKTAAMEAVWNTQKGAPFLIFAIPDQAKQKNYLEIKIPHGAALINTHQWNGNLVGLKSVARKDQPVVPFVFFSFRIMVGLGLLMLIFSIIALYYRRKKRLFNSPWFLKFSRIMIPAGFIALWCGWVTAEAGRQPWVVYNILRTKDVASHVPLSHVIAVFSLIIVIYGVIFGYFYFHYLIKVIRTGPEIVKMDAEDQPFQYMSSGSKEEK
ncbi:MAG: cytochrome ubiquinol oxidase subunit I [Coxiellaceae bacterium]|nr:cytochrome ubiquinol oxidase subunit I [Coxiellaceae bacterium]